MADQLALLFPDKFKGDITAMEFNDRVRRRQVAELKFILDRDQKHQDEVYNIDEYFIRAFQPKALDGNDPENVIYQQRKKFEKLCVILIDNGIADPQKMTVFRFQTLISYYESKKPLPGTSRPKAQPRHRKR